jgi:hypothetical protein
VYLDRLFTGEFLGTKSDIASGELRRYEFRKYNNIQGDYYIAQRFLHKIAMHVTKNYLASKLKGVKVPLILGVWGMPLSNTCCDFREHSDRIAPTLAERTPAGGAGDIR